MDDLAFLDATAQADLVRRKEVKPIELVDAAIERIERLNPTLNAVVTPMYDLARKAAAGPLPDGPFAGVPYLLKDLGAEYGGGLRGRCGRGCGGGAGARRSRQRRRRLHSHPGLPLRPLWPETDARSQPPG